MLYFNHISLKEGNHMATKKTASAKKSMTKKTSSNVTTVKAVSSKKSTSTLFGLKLTRSPQLGAGIAEFLGAFLLTAAVIAGQGQPIIVLFAIAGIALVVGGMSGAHLNPAVTLGAWATRKITGIRALVYIAAQLLGGALALVVLNGFISAAPEVGHQAAAYAQAAPTLFKATAIPQGKEWAIFFAELLGASIFAFSVATAFRLKERSAAALSVGLGLFVALLIAGSAAQFVGGTAILNPAVAVGLQAINFNSIWPIAVYVFAASLGGVIGFILNDLLTVESDGGRS